MPLRPEILSRALQQVLPKGFSVEFITYAGEWSTAVMVRRGAERARKVEIPRNAMLVSSAREIVDILIDAIEREFGLGRHATTPIIQPEPEWSPYP